MTLTHIITNNLIINGLNINNLFTNIYFPKKNVNNYYKVKKRVDAHKPTRNTPLTIQFLFIDAKQVSVRLSRFDNILSSVRFQKDELKSSYHLTRRTAIHLT